MVRELSSPHHQDTLQSEARYRADLARLDEMMNTVQPGTPEEVEYLALLDRLETYESAHFPIH